MNTIPLNYKTLEHILDWTANGNIGVSSNTILHAITGKSVYGESRDIPYDWSDFKRCVELLKHAPELTPYLHLVAETYPQWIPIIREWDALMVSYKNPDKLYKHLSSLRDECMECGGWEKTSDHSWRKKS